MRGLKKALFLVLLCIPLLLCQGTVVYASQPDSIFQSHDARDRCCTAPDSAAYEPDAVGYDKRRVCYPAGHVYASYPGKGSV